MATAENYDGAPNYWPNSYEDSPQLDPAYKDPVWRLGEVIVNRFDSTVDHDDYTQAGNLYRMFDEAHRDRLARRIAGVLGQARREVQLRHLCHFFRADEDYGRRVAQKLGIDVDAVMQRAGEATVRGVCVSDQGRASRRCRWGNGGSGDDCACAERDTESLS